MHRRADARAGRAFFQREDADVHVIQQRHGAIGQAELQRAGQGILPQQFIAQDVLEIGGCPRLAGRPRVWA
ncbi:MAG: hypothetical protein AB1713_05170 [Pseudomonadota bacterium]